MRSFLRTWSCWPPAAFPTKSSAQLRAGRRIGGVPRPIKAIEIYLPLDYNDGRSIEAAKYVPLEDELLERFGGVISSFTSVSAGPVP